MNKIVESGMLTGRPFGGVMAMIRNDLKKICETLHCDERYSVFRIANLFIANIYLPCVGTADRMSIYEEVFAEVLAWRDRFPQCECIIGGDFNVCLDKNDLFSDFVNNVCSEYCLTRCDKLFNQESCATYVNDALGHQSTIDYIVSSSIDSVKDFTVLEPDLNFSDHLPLMATIRYTMPPNDSKKTIPDKPNVVQAPEQLRWDHADVLSYCNYTRIYLQPVLAEINALSLQPNNITVTRDAIESLYAATVSVLDSGAKKFVPHCKKGFFKFWWDEEMQLLKDASIESNEAWKAAGKPRNGPVFVERQRCKMQYRKRLRENLNSETTCYTNDLHEALLNKNGPTFWNIWHSKFESRSKPSIVDACADPATIAHNFATYFSELYTATSAQRASELLVEFSTARERYVGTPLSSQYLCDTELVSDVIFNLKRGKAAGLDGLTAEHLLYCHPIVSCILSKLFNLMIVNSYVPAAFGYSYTVPLSKVSDCRTKALTCNDFRGIAISAIISKTFEYCILERFEHFLSSKDNQFGFKKGVGCTHAIYSARKTIERYVAGGSTVNIVH